MPRKYTMRSKEEKLSIVKQALNGAPVRNWESQGVRHRQVQDWTKAFLKEGEAGLEPKKKPGNPLSRYERRTELSYSVDILDAVKCRLQWDWNISIMPMF